MSDSEQCSNRLELDLISLLANFSCELGQIMAILDVRNSLLMAFLAISDQYKILFFTKWPAATILDVRNSLSITFLAILDQY